jgi:hypothetical protein
MFYGNPADSIGAGLAAHQVASDDLALLPSTTGVPLDWLWCVVFCRLSSGAVRTGNHSIDMVRVANKCTAVSEM